MTTSNTLGISIGVIALLAAGSAAAAKVNIPHEGSFEFDFCLVSETVPPLTGGDKFFVSHYKVVANIRTDPPGKPFDRQSVFCYGTFAALDGRNQDFGICEATDARRRMVAGVPRESRWRGRYIYLTLWHWQIRGDDCQSAIRGRSLARNNPQAVLPRLLP